MKPHSNIRGSTLITVIVIASISILVGLRVFSGFQNQLQDRRQIQLASGAAVARRTIINTIESGPSLLRTIQANANLSCLLTNGSDCNGRSGALDLRRSDNSIVVSPGGTSGFTLEGRPCSGFQPAGGNDACPLSYQLNFSFDCTASCLAKKPASEPFALSPAVRVTGQLLFRPKELGSLGSLNLTRFDINYLRGQSQLTAAELQNNCASMGGTWDAPGNKCELPVMRIGMCPTHHFFTGLDASNNPICRPVAMVGADCRGRSAVVGITDWGAFLCGKF